MIHGAKKLIPKLRKAPQPPLSHPGAIPDSDRAKKPPLGETRATNQELEPGDRVEGLGNFGTPTGEIGTVERANEDLSGRIAMVCIRDFGPRRRNDNVTEDSKECRGNT